MPLPPWQRPGLPTTAGDHEKRIRNLERLRIIAALGGDTIDQIILNSPGLDAFWKLNEAAGTIAHDSGPNSYDLTVADTIGTYSWGSPAGPPGQPTILFEGATASRTHPAFTNNFTAVAWIKQDTGIASGAAPIIGQGTPLHGSGHTGGWELYMLNTDHKLHLDFDDGAAYHTIAGNNALAEGTWWFVACVRDAGVFKLYVNGLLQAATSSAGVAANTALWLGYDNFAGTTFAMLGQMSYAALWSRPLSGAELLAMFNAGGNAAVPADYVLTSDGNGNTFWAKPKVTVYLNGV